MKRYALTYRREKHLRYPATRRTGDQAPQARSITGSAGYVREVIRSHLNFVVADTKVREQSAAYVLDTHDVVDAFVKNVGLGFAIPYLHNGRPHDYIPDFLVRLRDGSHLVLETKGFDDLADIKAAVVERWCSAVNADAQFGAWQYAMARSVAQVRTILDGLWSGGAAARTPNPEPRTSNREPSS